MLRLLWLSVLVVVLDQASKLWVVAIFDEYEVLTVWPVFNLTLVYNTGAAFSFLSDAGGWQRWFFVAIGVIIATAMAVWLSQLRAAERITAYGLAFIIGGAVGNLIDRVWLGRVVDFLQWHWHEWYWPAFNLADSAITLGVGLLLLDGLFSARRQGQRFLGNVLQHKTPDSSVTRRSDADNHRTTFKDEVKVQEVPADTEVAGSRMDRHQA